MIIGWQNREYSVLERLPSNGEKVLCFGHKTYCCIEDMEEKPDWHEVTFELCVSMYKLKKDLPADLEDSVIEKADLKDLWHCDEQEHVIGVTKWKRF